MKWQRERWRGGENEKKVEGRKSRAACQVLFHLCSLGLSELPPPLLSVTSWMKGPLRRDGGLDSGFTLWPTPAEAAKPSSFLFKLIGCHFQVQEAGRSFFFLSAVFLFISSLSFYVFLVDYLFFVFCNSINQGQSFEISNKTACFFVFFLLAYQIKKIKGTHTSCQNATYTVYRCGCHIILTFFFYILWISTFPGLTDLY